MIQKRVFCHLSKSIKFSQTFSPLWIGVESPLYLWSSKLSCWSTMFNFSSIPSLAPFGRESTGCSFCCFFNFSRQCDLCQNRSLQIIDHNDVLTLMYIAIYVAKIVERRKKKWEKKVPFGNAENWTGTRLPKTWCNSTYFSYVQLDELILDW